MEPRRCVPQLCGGMMPWSRICSTREQMCRPETKVHGANRAIVLAARDLRNMSPTKCSGVRWLAGTGWTALHAASFQEHGKVVRVLLAHQADPKTVDVEGRRAVDYASISEAIWPFFSGF
jgi:hypothetical protein